MRPEVIHDADPARLASDIVTSAIQEAVARRGSCHLVVSGGRTPGPFFGHLVSGSAVPWSQVHLFWADERFVPHDHADSNYGAARPTLVDRSGIPAQNVHPWPVSGDPVAAAEHYARTIERYAGSPPEFDVTVLGLGADGHTASLFPHAAALPRGGVTVATTEPSTGRPRLSLTLEAINSSRTVLFLVIGEDKREALSALLAGDPARIEELPARGVRAQDRLLVLTDVQT